MPTKKKQTYHVRGMSCAACVARVERGVSRLKGVEKVQVNLILGRMQVQYQSTETDEESIISTVRQMGYEASLLQQNEMAVVLPPASHLRTRFLISLVLLMPMVILHHLVHGAISDIAQLILLLPILYINRIFFIRGGKALWQKAPNMDSLVALGAAAAIADGVGNFLFEHRGSLYFESAAMILTIITLGKWLEARATSKTGDAVEKLKQLLPETATVIREQKTVTIPAAQVEIDDVVLVSPGENIPIDGIVISGHSGVNEASLTGESIPTEKTAGDTVYAGTTNGGGVLHIKTTKRRTESTMADIIRLVGDAAAGKAPIARLADKVSGVFVPIVMSVALLTTLIWLAIGYGSAFAISCGIAVLIISCPCALGLATPLAIMVGMGKGAEAGILFRNAEALESARDITCLALDKTGTLTTGNPTVCDIIPAPGHTKEELLELAAIVEHGSKHPLAAAIAAYCPPGAAPQSSQYLPGLGIEAQHKGSELLAGNPRLMKSKNISYDLALADSLTHAGKTPLFFARNGSLVGIMAVQDALRPEAPEAIKELQRMGIRLCMMTGDQSRTASAIGQTLHIQDIHAECLPTDKEVILRQLKNEGEIIGMVGDGINDAPALMRADVGISLSGGIDIAKESADIILVHNKLSDIAPAVRLSRAVIRNIRQNLVWAFAYNTLAIPLAAGLFYPMFGWLLQPAAAATAMGLSSLCVVSNALRLRRFSLHRHKTMNKELTLTVNGMMCPHCEQHVTKALLALPGVLSCTANHKTNSVTITLAPEGTSDSDTIKVTIAAAGYEVK